MPATTLLTLITLATFPAPSAYVPVADASRASTSARELEHPGADTIRVGFIRAAARTPAAAGTVAVTRRATELGAAIEAERGAEDGARLGAEEVARTAQLIGGSFELLVRDAARAEHLPELVRELVEDDAVAAIVGGFDEPACLALAALAERHGILFLNLGCRSDRLRNESCRRHTFHIEASDAMRQDAAAAPESSVVELWHPDLDRYGAAQLNERFRTHFERPMDSYAWAGWLAIKVIWETVLRVGTTDGKSLVRALEGGPARFDGHKGRPLSFRPWDHQLRQPLYLVPGATVGKGSTAELPFAVPTAAPGETVGSSELLDRIGTPAAASRCRFGG